MKLKQATLADFESVLAFYGDVMDRTPEIARYARWQKGKHPTSEGIKTFTVLKSSVENYRTATGWSRFGNYLGKY